MIPPRQLPGADKRVQLMATCLCDAFYADAARATVEVARLPKDVDVEIEAIALAK